MRGVRTAGRHGLGVAVSLVSLGWTASAFAEPPAASSATPRIGVVPDTEVPPPPPASDVSAGLLALLDTGAIAQPALGAGVALIGRLGTLGLGSYAQWLPSRRTPVPGTDRDLQFEQWALGLRPCRTVGGAGRRWSLDACASAEIGRVLVRGLDVDRTTEKESSWLAAGVGIALRWSHAEMAFESRADTLFPLLRERYVVDATNVHETPGATFRLALGVLLGL